MFALILCAAAGITPIITSSSDEKLAQLKKFWPASEGVNYKTTADQQAEVSRITGGKGVDVVINNTGPGSIITDLKSLRTRGGVVSLVGFLEGISAEWSHAETMALMTKTAMIKRIGVGSKVDFEHLNSFLEEQQVSLTPLIGRTFAFEDSPKAFDYLYSGKHIGKVVIKL